jgi:hypothetical protein
MPFFQALLHLIQAHPNDARLELIRELFAAIEAENGAKVTLLLRRVVSEILPRLLPVVDIPASVWHEALVRLLYLGEHIAFDDLLEWYEPGITFTSGRKELMTETLEGVFGHLRYPAARLSDMDVDRELKRITTALRYVVAAHSLEARNEVPPRWSPGEPAPGSFGSATVRPSRTTVLRGAIRPLVRGWMEVHQQLYDAAWQHLGSKAPNPLEKTLALRDRFLAAQVAVFGPQREGHAKPVDVDIPLARIEYGRSPHHEYRDMFLPTIARSYGFMPYSREPPEKPETKPILLSDLMRYRSRQLQTILDEFGHFEPSAERPRTQAAKEALADRVLRSARRRKVIAGVASQARSLRLDTEDELASFACAFYHSWVGVADPRPTEAVRADAWHDLIVFFERYLQIYTTHTEFNLDEGAPYDRGRPYFDLLMPRAINGGQLLDCGVYAVRMAFTFLTLAGCAQAMGERPPNVRFVLLPLHVGLIVDIDPFPPLFIHNDVLFRPTADDVDRWREEWEASSHAAGDPPDPADREQMFLEDVAAMTFLADLDMPISSHAVAPVGVPPRKNAVWTAYQKLVAKRTQQLFSKSVLDPARPEYQFDLRFLTATVEEKRWFDDMVVPFWNVEANQLWHRVADSDGELPGTRREAYRSALDAAIGRVSTDYDRKVRDPKEKLSAEFRASENTILGPAARRITRSERLKEAALDLGKMGAARTHLVNIVDGKRDIPDFAHEAGFIPKYRE